MKITFRNDGILQIDDAMITYRNFRGEGSKYNREGDRNFSVIIRDEDIAEALMQEGWNVKIKQSPSMDPDEPPRMYLPVKVKFNRLGPHCHLISGSSNIKLTEETVSCLDQIYISSVDLDVRPYDWEVNGKQGRTAYLQSIRVVQRIDDRFADEEYPEE